MGVRNHASWLALLFACNEAAKPPDPPVEPPPPVVPPVEKVFEPGPAVLPRLTEKQYRNTLSDLFGTRAARVALEPDTNPYLFYSIGATSTALSERGTQSYADAAAAVLDAATVDQTFLGCAPQAAGDACTSDFLARFGRRMFRRPLTQEELDRWVAVARDTGDVAPIDGVRFALYGMLQSPNFLYRFEEGEPDPKNTARRRYTSYEMAERLAFFLWNTTPDDQLLDAAERDELTTDAGLRREAQRLIASPRAREPVQDFFSQYFDLQRLSGVERDVARYPLYSHALIDAMRHEIRLLVEDFVFRTDGDIRQIFSTRRTFVNTPLAALYQVEAPGASPIAFVPVELPADGPRAGLLTLGAFLAMNAHPTETSPTLRGKYVRERVLCQTVPPPPDNVDTELGPTMEARTLRERLEQHRHDPGCAGCHSFIDPPGFLFESFDSIGVYRTEVDGIPLDTSGDLDGTPLADARDLARELSNNAQVSACIVKQLYRHASGRLDERSEERALIDVEKKFAAQGYRFSALLLELVQSEGFRTLEVQP
jgi:hypothetical protein